MLMLTIWLGFGLAALTAALLRHLIPDDSKGFLALLLIIADFMLNMLGPFFVLLSVIFLFELMGF